MTKAAVPPSRDSLVRFTPPLSRGSVGALRTNTGRELKTIAESRGLIDGPERLSDAALAPKGGQVSKRRNLSKISARSASLSTNPRGLAWRNCCPRSLSSTATCHRLLSMIRRHSSHNGWQCTSPAQSTRRLRWPPRRAWGRLRAIATPSPGCPGQRRPATAPLAESLQQATAGLAWRCQHFRGTKRCPACSGSTSGSCHRRTLPSARHLHHRWPRAASRSHDIGRTGARRGHRRERRVVALPVGGQPPGLPQSGMREPHELGRPGAATSRLRQRPSRKR